MPLFRRVALLQPRIPDGNDPPNLGIMYLAGVLIDKGYNVRNAAGSSPKGAAHDSSQN
ncbi:MAG: hypothetical protein AMXMBFR20_17580 [Planctomycetia bacterium]